MVDKIEVHVFDETLELALVLWGHQAISASAWKPSHTVLLLTDAGLRSRGRVTLTIDDKTLVDVDPDIPDAHWLRNFAEGLAKRQHVNPRFSEEGMTHERVSFLQPSFFLKMCNSFPRKGDQICTTTDTLHAGRAR